MYYYLGVWLKHQSSDLSSLDLGSSFGNKILNSKVWIRYRTITLYYGQTHAQTGKLWRAMTVSILEENYSDYLVQLPCGFIRLGNNCLFDILLSDQQVIYAQSLMMSYTILLCHCKKTANLLHSRFGLRDACLPAYCSR